MKGPGQQDRRVGHEQRVLGNDEPARSGDLVEQEVAQPGGDEGADGGHPVTGWALDTPAAFDAERDPGGDGDEGDPGSLEQSTPPARARRGEAGRDWRIESLRVRLPAPGAYQSTTGLNTKSSAIGLAWPQNGNGKEPKAAARR